jgi:hypothetical protein
VIFSAAPVDPQIRDQFIRLMQLDSADLVPPASQIDFAAIQRTVV